ncbi:MAG: hypothetical protein J6B39_09090 [Lachnospiraceae bacterium]|nr:hypothetical protein [Lachnospiraceae bacterium]
MKILKNQQNIKEVMAQFNCNASNIEQNKFAFDLCAFYMAQIGEASKLLTDDTKKALEHFDADTTKYFRNMVDHVYEKVNKTVLKAYIFDMISNDTVKEIKARIKYCNEHAKDNK